MNECLLPGAGGWQLVTSGHRYEQHENADHSVGDHCYCRALALHERNWLLLVLQGAGGGSGSFQSVDGERRSPDRPHLLWSAPAMPATATPVEVDGLVSVRRPLWQCAQGGRRGGRVLPLATGDTPPPRTTRTSPHKTYTIKLNYNKSKQEHQFPVQEQER